MIAKRLEKRVVPTISHFIPQCTLIPHILSNNFHYLVKKYFYANKTLLIESPEIKKTDRCRFLKMSYIYGDASWSDHRFCFFEECVQVFIELIKLNEKCIMAIRRLKLVILSVWNKVGQFLLFVGRIKHIRIHSKY